MGSCCLHAHGHTAGWCSQEAQRWPAARLLWAVCAACALQPSQPLQTMHHIALVSTHAWCCFNASTVARHRAVANVYSLCMVFKLAEMKMDSQDCWGNSGCLNEYEARWHSIPRLVAYFPQPLQDIPHCPVHNPCWVRNMLGTKHA